MRDYLKRLKVCIKWVQKSFEDLAMEKDNLRNMLDSLERNCVKAGPVTKPSPETCASFPFTSSLYSLAALGKVVLFSFELKVLDKAILFVDCDPVLEILWSVMILKRLSISVPLERDLKVDGILLTKAGTMIGGASDGMKTPMVPPTTSTTTTTTLIVHFSKRSLEMRLRPSFYGSGYLWEPWNIGLYFTSASSIKDVSSRSFFKKKLIGPSFIDWYRQLRLVLSTEDKENYLEHPIPTAPVAPPGQQVPSEALATHAAWTVREFHTSKQKEDQLVSSHVLKMKGYIDNLERLGQPVGQNLATVNELHAMLKLHEETLPKKDANHAIRAGKGLQGSKKLKPCALSLYVGDGHRAAVEAIRTYHLELPIGLVIVLNNCHYAPSITRGVISVSRLFDDGFINRFDDNNVISVSKNNLVYFMAVPRDGIYEIDMSYSNTNDSSMYAITNKRSKLNLDSSLLWHCRLGHISKKRIEKLQHDGLLNSIDIESLGKCVSYMSGKMARKPYSHQVERARDLLGLIHTDVCDPFKIVSRQAASYFVTFTDDFSRYSYVYLLKYKHKVFETFKVFQKEVENQLGKTIKSLRSDRRGYPKETMGYSFYNPSENKVFVAQNAEFFESKLLYLKASRSVEDLELIQEEDTNSSVDTSLNHKEDDQEIDKSQSDINPIRDLGEPANYKVALLDPESKKWLDAMNVEMQSMKDNDVWVLVELPPNARTVGSKWLFKKKTDMDGAVYIFKARLVAKGFTQTYGVDYEETFSPVANIRAIRILIAIAAIRVKNTGAVKNILKYLRNTKDMFLVYGGNMEREIRVSCYIDAGYLTNADNLKSQTKYVFVLNRGVVAWKSTKQSIFATLSTNVEYIVAFDASKEVVRIHKFIFGLGIVLTIKEPINMYRDNTRAIAIAKDDGVTKGARHFRAKVHYLRETIKLGDVKIENIDTEALVNLNIHHKQVGQRKRISRKMQAEKQGYFTLVRRSINNLDSCTYAFKYCLTEYEMGIFEPVMYLTIDNEEKIREIRCKYGSCQSTLSPMNGVHVGCDYEEAMAYFD
nr:hypothetical protein [Tanacetum cinerariifolium]